jgi:hypothetical protein
MHRHTTHKKCYNSFKDFSIITLNFLRDDVPTNWRSNCDRVTGDFRVIDPKNAGYRVSGVQPKRRLPVARGSHSKYVLVRSYSRISNPAWNSVSQRCRRKLNSSALCASVSGGLILP